MIERQPADEHVRAFDAKRAAHRPDVGEQLRMCEHDALGVPGAPRGVLQKGERITGCWRHLADDTLADERRHGFDAPQTGNIGLQQSAEPMHRVIGQHGNDARVPQQLRMASNVLLQLCRFSRRVDRDGYAAAKKHAYEGSEIVGPCRQHQRDGFAGNNAPRLQRAAQSECGFPQHRMRDGTFPVR